MKNSLAISLHIQLNMQSHNFVIKLLTLLMKNNYTLGVFIDFSKAFDTVGHKILIKKLEKNGVKHIPRLV